MLALKLLIVSIKIMLKHSTLVKVKNIFLVHYPTNNEQICVLKKNQRFLLNFGALIPNLFLVFFQHVRFLR
jgi:hypothetical protein